MRAERTIVLLKQFLGDGVMAEPLVSALADNYSHVDVLALPSVQQVLAHLDGRVSFMRMEKVKTLRDTMDQARMIRRKGYDVAFLVNRSFRSAVLARLAKIPVRVGHGTEGRSFLLTRSVPYRMEDFEAKSYADLAGAVGIDVTRLQPKLAVSEAESASGRQLAAGATVAIQPGARREDKQIPVEVLSALVRALHDRNHRIVLIGGPEEAEAGKKLAASVDGKLNDLIGKLDLRQTLSLLANVRATVGGDTGVMHLSVGVGTPTVTAFGPTPSAKWGHEYAPHKVLIAPKQEIGELEPGALIGGVLQALGEP